MTSVLSSASTTVLGLVSALVMWLGGHSVLRGTWTVGDYFSYNMFLAFMIAPVFQIVNIGTQLTEAFAGLDRTGEIMSELEENQSPERTLKMPPIQGTCASKMSNLPTRQISPYCTASALTRCPHRHSAGRFVGLRQIHDYQSALCLSHAFHGPHRSGRHRSRARRSQYFPFAAWCGAAGLVSFRRLDSRERDVLSPRRDRGAVSFCLPYGTRRRICGTLPGEL